MPRQDCNLLRFRVLLSRLPDDVVLLLFVNEMVLRFVQGLGARRRAARSIQMAWDRHIMFSLPPLVPVPVIDMPWVVQYTHGQWIAWHENMSDDDVEEVN